MAERASVFEGAFVGVESVPGTAVPATIRLQALGISPSIRANIKKSRPEGTKYNTVSAMGKEWTEAALTGQPTYNEMVYPFSSIFGAAAISTPGGGTLSRDWLWTPKIASPDSPATLTVEKGSRVRAMRFTYGLVNELTLGFKRDDLTLAGQMFGQKITDGIKLSTNATYTLTAAASPPTAGTYTLTKNAQTTSAIAFGAAPAVVQAALEALSTVGVGNVTVTLTALGPTTATANTVYTIEFINDLSQLPVTLTGSFGGLTPASSIAIAAGAVGVTPTALTLIPILPEHFSIYADTTFGGLGTSKLLRWLSGELRIRNRFAPLWVLDAAQGSYVAHVELAPEVQLMVKLESDAAGMAYLAKMRANTRTFIRAEAIGPLIEGALFNRFRLDMACDVTEQPPFSDEQGVYAVDWMFTAMADGGWNKAFEISLRNSVAAL